MKVDCTSTPEGRVYLFYRASDDFTSALKPLIPFLLAGHANVVLGSEDGDRKVVLRFGPISGEPEAALVKLIGPRLNCRCEPVAPEQVRP